MKILVSGQMRSGTTLLSNVLSAQPGMTVPADFLHIDRLKSEANAASLRERLSPAQKELVIARFIGQPGSDGWMAIVDATGADFRFRVEPSQFDNLLEFYELVLNQLRSESVTVVGHKSTCAENVFEEILGCVSDLKIIYMMRDPRDVVLSNGRMMGQEPAVVLRNWQTGYRETLRVRALRAASNRVEIVRYEDLVRTPDVILRRLGVFLGRGPLVHPDEVKWHGAEFVSNSSFGDIRKLFDPSGLARWKTADPQVATLAEALVGSDLRRAGYSTPLRTRFRGWVASRSDERMTALLAFRPRPAEHRPRRAEAA